jgi:hypothetical protein
MTKVNRQFPTSDPATGRSRPIWVINWHHQNMPPLQEIPVVDEGEPISKEIMGCLEAKLYKVFNKLMYILILLNKYY